MPKFIWVVEISNFTTYCDGRKVLGEIIFDSTANKYDTMGSFLSVHLPGIFFKNKDISEKVIFDEKIGREQPYSILKRA